MSEFKKILDPIADLLAKKQADYNDSYTMLREKYGPVGFYIRAADKLNRIEQLDRAGAQVSSETVMDNLQDIVGYCVLEIRHRERKGDGTMHNKRCCPTCSDCGPPGKGCAKWDFCTLEHGECTENNFKYWRPKEENN